MPGKRAQRRAASDERGRRGGGERPTVVTAAGLLAFYEEEESLVKIRPIHVLAATITFIAVIVALNIFG